MKTPILLVLTAFLFLFISAAVSQDLQGTWDYFDPATGKLAYTVVFKEKNQKWSAKINYLDPNAKIKTCANCKGELENKALLGLEIAWDLLLINGELESGRILDPESGKVYDCSISFSGNDLLLVRGYYKIKVFGKTILWRRRK